MTERGLAMEWPGTVETGRVAVRLGGTTRVAEEQLNLNRRRLGVGYYFRFARQAARGMMPIGNRVSVAVQAAQTVDLVSAGVTEDRWRAKTTRLVTVDRPAVAIEPRDGVCENGVGDVLWVRSGRREPLLLHVEYLGVPRRAQLGRLCSRRPGTGLFSFTSNPGTSIISTAQGAFRDNTSAVVKAIVSYRECNYRVVPSTFSLSTDT